LVSVVAGALGSVVSGVGRGVATVASAAASAGYQLLLERMEALGEPPLRMSASLVPLPPPPVCAGLASPADSAAAASPLRSPHPMRGGAGLGTGSRVPAGSPLGPAPVSSDARGVLSASSAASTARAGSASLRLHRMVWTEALQRAAELVDRAAVASGACTFLVAPPLLAVGASAAGAVVAPVPLLADVLARATDVSLHPVSVASLLTPSLATAVGEPPRRQLAAGVKDTLLPWMWLHGSLLAWQLPGHGLLIHLASACRSSETVLAAGAAGAAPSDAVGAGASAVSADPHSACRTAAHLALYAARLRQVRGGGGTVAHASIVHPVLVPPGSQSPPQPRCRTPLSPEQPTLPQAWLQPLSHVHNSVCEPFSHRHNSLCESLTRTRSPR
jgi:hypothetical protein